MIFVDTNYFLRFLLKDVEKEFRQAGELIRSGAEGKTQLFTSTIVFFEIYWVLSSYYGKNKVQLLNTLEQIIGLEFIFLAERLILQDSLKLFSASNLSLEDCYNLSYAKARKAEGFKTFDKKLAKFFP